MDLEGSREVVKVEAPSLYETLTTYDNGTTVRWRMDLDERGGGTDVSSEIDYQVPPGPLYALAERLLLRPFFVSNLESGDRRFNAIVRREAASL